MSATDSDPTTDRDPADRDPVPPGPLGGVRVIDAATIYAGPMIATLFADFGADVIKLEHPRGDGLRKWEWRKDGESLWWAVVNRNKRALSVSLSDPRGADVLRGLLADTDVFVENFRPGTLEKWGLAPEKLWEINPRLVVVRVSGYGQTGPYRSRPGFGTLAEAFSGFADTNGTPGGPPLLPQWPLADGITALAGAFATMTALRHAEHTGQGQVVDLSIYEPLFWILGAQTTAYDQLGLVPERRGNRTAFTVPRGCYRTRDGRWVALSGATTVTGQRILRAVGRDDLADAPWFDEITGKLAHQDEIDQALSSWIAERDNDDVLATFTELGATVGPVQSIADIVADPHVTERGSVTSVDHPVLGPVLMQGMVARLSRTPGSVRHPGAPQNAHLWEILQGELGLDETTVRELIDRGLVGTPADEQERPGG